MTDRPAPETTDDAARLAAQADARRRDGTYPTGIDEQLANDLDRRLDEARTQSTELRAALGQLRDAGRFRLRDRSADRGLKAVYSRAVELLVGHSLRDILRQLDAHQAALDRVLTTLIDRVEGGPPDDGPTSPG